MLDADSEVEGPLCRPAWQAVRGQVRPVAKVGLRAMELHGLQGRELESCPLFGIVRTRWIGASESWLRVLDAAVEGVRGGYDCELGTHTK